MRKTQNYLNIAVILSETSHVFCCVLPTLFSVMSLFVGLGMVTAVPLWLQDIHSAMHHWELPIILTSGAILAMGWGIHFYSRKIDCHDTGCHHPPCAPVKKKTNTVLKIASILFIINIAVYLIFHREMQIFVPNTAPHKETHDHGHGH